MQFVDSRSNSLESAFEYEECVSPLPKSHNVRVGEISPKISSLSMQFLEVPPESPTKEKHPLRRKSSGVNYFISSMKYKKDMPKKDDTFSDEDEKNKTSSKPIFDTVHLDDFRNFRSSCENITFLREGIEIKTIDGKSKIKINSPNARVHSVLHK